MATIGVTLFLVLLGLVLLLHIFSLPANWGVLLLAGGYFWLVPDSGLSWGVLTLLLGLALAAELLEFVVQIFGAKKFGSSGKGNFGGIVGAIAGAIVGAPFFFGVGALFGALLGAYAGCLILEIGQGREFSDASRAAWGAFWGKFIGLVLKFSMGAAMVAIIARTIWV